MILLHYKILYSKDKTLANTGSILHKKGKINNKLMQWDWLMDN